MHFPTAQSPFAEWQVIEFSGGIAVSYCAKMLADAGADVVKIESDDGDPMRRWSATADGRPGALFGYLAAGKKSVTDRDDTAALLGRADVILTDLSAGWSLPNIEAAAAPRAVILTVTPFGLTGPYVDAQVSANEFILQALCGSTAGRGWPGEEPLQAGGRIGEWLAGTFAAVVAAAAGRHARNGGAGGLIDFSVYEAMVIAMGSLPAMSASVLGTDAPGQERSVELPSIVPTADGLVGLCTITAQQFQDFLIMIDRADLLDDTDLASMPGRIARRDEFLAIVQTWTETRTTDEIIELAAAFRIPVAPIGTPATVTQFDHFQQRGVFVTSRTGVLRPRVPYLSDSIAIRPTAPAPALGAHNHTVKWDTRPERLGNSGDVSLPLSGVRIADLTAFWAGPVCTQVLAAFGADVVKIEGVHRPDGMRFSGGRPPSWDHWWEWGPVFLCSNTNKRDVSIELSDARGRALALDLFSRSDVIIENFSPRVMANFDLEWDAVRAVNPAAIMLRMPAFGLDGPWRDRVGFAQTMEQASGMAWMTGHADGPPIIPRGVCDPLAGLHAAFATIAALAVRDRTGTGLHIESAMVESALNITAEIVLEYGINGVEMRRTGNRGPGASPQGVYPCAGADEWVAMAVLDDADWPGLAAMVGRPDLGRDTTLTNASGRYAQSDEIDKFISAWTAQRTVAEAVAALRASGIAAAPLTAPSGLLSDEQLLDRGFWETVAHPVAGEFLCTGMPFVVVGQPRRWIRSPAPLYGQHTEEVLTDILGMSSEDIADLRALRVISDRPAGL